MNVHMFELLVRSLAATANLDPVQLKDEMYRFLRENFDWADALVEGWDGMRKLRL